MENSKRYTTDELAKELHLSRREIDRLRKQGLIPFLKVGEGRGRFLYILENVQNALAKLEEKNQLQAAENYKQAVAAEGLEVWR